MPDRLFSQSPAQHSEMSPMSHVWGIPNLPDDLSFVTAALESSEHNPAPAVKQIDDGSILKWAEASGVLEIILSSGKDPCMR